MIAVALLAKMIHFEQISVGALKTRLQRYEQDQEAKESASKISEFVKNMNSMGIYSQSNPHAFETICRWIYAGWLKLQSRNYRLYYLSAIL